MKNILLKDDRILLSNKIEVTIMNGKKVNLIEGVITYIPDHCYNCGATKEYIAKYGYVRKSIIKIGKVNNVETYINLKRQRCICYKCRVSFAVKCDYVKSRLRRKRDYDIVGKRFGKLLVTEKIKNEYDNKVFREKILWRCQCYCGSVIDLPKAKLNINTKSCGCIKKRDLKGKRFWKLVVIEKTSRRLGSNVIWKCICDCGSTHETTSAKLTTGHTKSCGCLRACDITGEKFGILLVEDRTNEREYGSLLWKCRCECGNITYKTAISLKSSKGTISCGCLRIKDIVGKRFGPFVVIEKTDKRFHRNVVWKCRCECGNIKEVPIIYLKSYKTKKCRCSHEDIE